MSTVRIHAPGKAMLAGEYAVTELGFPALVVATPVGVTCEASPSGSDDSILDAPDIGLEGVRFLVSDGKPEFPESGGSEEKAGFAATSAAITLEALEKRGLAPKGGIHLRIQSDLSSQEGKYGLGSSAAVSAAVTAAVWTLATGEIPNRQIAFPLAYRAHYRVQGQRGSGADVAACVNGGIIKYHKIDPEKSIDVPQYLPASLTIPEDLLVLIVWSGQSASTTAFLDAVQAMQDKDPKTWNAICHYSTVAAMKLANGLKSANRARTLTACEEAGDVLREIGAWAGISIETPELEEIRRLARRNNGAGKVSGAGGGDLAIVLGWQGDLNRTGLDRDLAEAGYTIVSEGVSPEGVRTVSS